MWESVRISVDDVIIHAPTMPELVNRLRQVFERYRQYILKLNKSKCGFGVSKISILGHIIAAEGIQPDPTKTVAIITTPPPPREMSPIFDLFPGHVVTWLSLFETTPTL